MTDKKAVGICVVLAALAVLLAAGCVKKITLTPEGKKVEFVENREVIADKLADKSKCKLMVTLKITAQGSPGLMANTKKEEQEDRLIRARNAGAREGANVLVAISEVVERAREYEAYKCN